MNWKNPVILLSNETNVLFEIRYTTDFYLYSKRKQSKARIAHVSLRNTKDRVENTTSRYD